jgi:VCBS repeat-containing protein
VFRAGNPHRYIVDRIADHHTDSVEHTWLVSHGGYRLFRMPVTSFSSWRFNWTNRPVTVAMRIVKKPFQTPEIVRMRRPFAAVAVLSAAAAVLALAGCGSSSTSPSQTNFKSLPQAEQTAFEQSAVTEVEASVLSFTSTDPTSLFFFNKVASKRFTGGMRMAGSKTTPRFQNTSCSNESGNSNDEDQDGVVDADSVTFACTDTASGETITENGFFSWGDPTPTTADLEINDAANLQLGVTGSTDGNINLSLVGNAAITQTSSTLNLAGNWAIDETLANNPQNENGTFKLSADENATWTWTGSAPTYFGTLTAGTVSLTGNWSYDINTTNTTVNLAFSVSTPTVLTIDSQNCTTNDSGIVSGEVDIKFNDGTVVKAVWSGCPAQPSITVT